VSIILKTFCNISFTKLSTDFTISFQWPSQEQERKKEEEGLLLVKFVCS